MKNLVKKTVQFITGAKVHAMHTAIKGKKSGGARDNNGVDWKSLPSGPGDQN